MVSVALPKIVLTGGPGGGKTTFLRELRALDPEVHKFILVPEAATLLIQAGHRPGTKVFQLAVVELQRSLEASCALPASPDHVLVCDRSTVDSLAYWILLGGSEDEYFERTGLDPANHLTRYDGVIHLQTAAIGASSHYLQISEGARVETTEEAAKVDTLCLSVWKDHSYLRQVTNEYDRWEDKSRAAYVHLIEIIESIRSEKESSQ